MIERAVVMSPQDVITAEFLALSPQEQTKPGSLQPLTEAKEAFEKEYLTRLTPGHTRQYLQGGTNCRTVSCGFL